MGGVTIVPGATEYAVPSNPSYTSQNGCTTEPPEPEEPPEPRYQPLAGDFNGDGFDDIVLRRVSSGTFYIRFGPVPFNTPDQISHTWTGGYHLEPFAGDFNGDGTDDLGLRRIATGELYVRYGPAFDVQVRHVWGSATNYQPMGGDVNGDGIDDIVLRRVSTGVFLNRYGPSPMFDAFPQDTYAWGAGGGHLEPFMGDFDGNGYDDYALRRIATGELYIRNAPVYDVQWRHVWAGGVNFQPFAGDFNGDGFDDLALRKVSTGMIYIHYGPAPLFDTFPQETHDWVYG
jgi:hypothetical protein